jgi:translation initiation factor IF-1
VISAAAAAAVVVNTAAAVAAVVAVVVATKLNQVSAAGFSSNLNPAVFVGQLMKEEPIEVEGRVHTVLPGTMFRVELDNKHLVLATICGKMRKRFVRLTTGDRVKMEMSPYDLNKARITWRLQ